MLKPNFSTRSKRALIVGVVIVVVVLVAHRSIISSETNSTQLENAGTDQRENVELTDYEISSSVNTSQLSPVDSAVENTYEQIDFIDETELAVESNKQLEIYVPLQEIEPTDKQARLLYEAEEVLVKQCMNERGFEYIRNSYDDDSLLDYQPEIIEPGDIAAAKVKGYGLAESLSNMSRGNQDDTGHVLSGQSVSLPPEAPNDNLVSKLSVGQQQEWKRAFMGEISTDRDTKSDSQVSVENPLTGSIITWDSNSCIAVAEGQLYGSSVELELNANVRYALEHQVYSAAEEDVDYQVAISQWQNCMFGYGYEFERPEQVVEVLVSEFKSGNISKEQLRDKEIEIATLDATCYQQASVNEAYNAVLKRSEKSVLSERSQQIEELSVAIENAVNIAKGI